MMPPSSPPNWPGVPPQPPTFWQRTRAGVARWWGAGLWQKVALLAIVPVLVACTCCGGLAVFALTPAGQQLARQTQATETAQGVAGIRTQERQAVIPVRNSSLDSPARIGVTPYTRSRDLAISHLLPAHVGPVKSSA